MVTTRAAGRSRFKRQQADQSHSPLICLPAELRCKIYAEVYQPRIYRYYMDPSVEVKDYQCEVAHPNFDPSLCRDGHSTGCVGGKSKVMELEEETHRRSTCRQYHHNCACDLKGTVRFLRVCQHVYFEAQPYFLRSAKLAFRSPAREWRQTGNGPNGGYWDDIILANDGLTTQLKTFRQKYLRSTLSGLNPITCLRHIRLAIAHYLPEEVASLQFLGASRWNLDSLDVTWQYEFFGLYYGSPFMREDWFVGMSCLRDVQSITLHWDLMRRGFLIVDNYDGPRQPDGRPTDPGIGEEEYVSVINRAFSELVSRPTTEGRRTRAFMYEQLKTRFPTRLKELMDEAGLSFGGRELRIQKIRDEN